MKTLSWGAAGVTLAALVVWMTLAIHYWPLQPAWLRVTLSVLVPIGAVVALLLVRRRRLAALGIVAMFALVLAAWLAIPASNDRDWQPDVAALAFAEIQGDRITVHNVRNNEYRSETNYTVRLEDRTLELSRLRSLDLFLSYWGSPAIAHTVMSWGFDDGQYLAISIETRKEKGEEYSTVKGFFRQYELVYVVADERDVIGLRTNHRGEDVYVYRLGVPTGHAGLLLLDYLRTVNRLREHPEWYNALTQNCTTTIRGHAAPYARQSWWSWKLFLNGHVDELAYDLGVVNRSLSFPALKAKSRINERARAADRDPTFSAQIRDGVPGMGGGRAGRDADTAHRANARAAVKTTGKYSGRHRRIRHCARTPGRDVRARRRLN